MKSMPRFRGVCVCGLNTSWCQFITVITNIKALCGNCDDPYCSEPLSTAPPHSFLK